MIAKNFMTYPEALRFQRELFSNGHHNSPRIMRLMECIFNQKPTAPEWFKAAKQRARDLAKRIKKAMKTLFEKPEINSETLKKKPFSSHHSTP